MTARVSIKRNIFANYAAQTYTLGIGVVMAPIYLSYMGAEAYGLIGFFTMMTAWFQLLDMGLTPTIARETARFRGGAIGVDALRVLLRALEVVFGVVSLLGSVILVLMSGEIASHWLHVKNLPIEQVSHALMIMGLTVPLRWFPDYTAGSSTDSSTRSGSAAITSLSQRRALWAFSRFFACSAPLRCIFLRISWLWP